MPETITRPPGPEVRRDFTLYAGLSKAYRKTVEVAAADGGAETEREELYLSGVASSTARDRHGDTMTPRAQASMLAQLQQGFGRDGHSLLMFLNHEYDVPEDVLGSVTESQLVAAQQTDGQDALIDLEIVCRIAQDNPRAVMAFKIVEAGHTIGISIGGAITECEVDEENDDGESWCPPLIINDIALYEISACGIPANPRAYTTATKALVKEVGLPDDMPEPTKDWPRAMRTGFVRNATRDPKVRAQLRRALPALKAHGTEDLPTDQPVTPDDLPIDETTSQPVQRATDARDQSAIAASIGCLERVKSHGMCNDGMKDVQAALDSLTGALAPAPDETGKTLALVRALPEAQQIALLAAVKALADDSALTVLAGADLDAQLAQRRTELDQLAADAAARTTERDAALAEATAAKAETEAALAATATAKSDLATLTAQHTALAAKVAELAATPAGRKTGGVGSSSGYDPYRVKTRAQLSAELAAAVAHGPAATNDAQRPA